LTINYVPDIVYIVEAKHTMFLIEI